MASNGAWGMPQPQPQPQQQPQPQPQPQPQHTWDVEVYDNQPPPPTYEEATNSMPQPHGPFPPSYHPSAPTAPYLSSYPYPSNSCQPSAPTTDPTTKPPYPTEIPYPVTVYHPNTTPYPTTTPTSMPFTNTTPQHDPLLGPPRDTPDSEPVPVVVVAEQPSQQEEKKASRTAKICVMAVAAMVIVGVVFYVLKYLIPGLLY